MAGEIPAQWDVTPLFTVAREREVRNAGTRETNVLSLSYGRIIRRDVSDNFGFTLRTGDVLITKDSESWTDIAVPAVVAEDLPEVLCGYRLAVDKYLAERGHPFQALVAFSGAVQDGGQSYTESGMNGFPEAQTAKTFERSEYRFLMERLDDDAALDAAARVNTRENVRLTFDQKVEHVIQEIVDSNFDLYKRITDDRVFGEAIKNFLFDQYLRAHRNAEELIKAGESKTLEFKSTLRWSLKEDRQDDKGVTHAVLKTIAAFLNTEGGDLLIGVADDGSIVGIERDRLESDDKFMRHLAQVVRNGLGDRAGTCIRRAPA